ncbi:MAG: AzlD domain-containing protein [Anaerolineales bacterium]|nr:AzlD domain-containing protein [Anaerolineales bacterium]
MSYPWLVMIIIGVLTFATRISFIVLLERWQTPSIIRRALRFVPVSVLTAIFVPELLSPEGVPDVSLNNLRLLAGGIAMLVAWKTKNVIWTIIAGMGSLFLLQWFL